MNLLGPKIGTRTPLLRDFAHTIRGCAFRPPPSLCFFSMFSVRLLRILRSSPLHLPPTCEFVHVALRGSPYYPRFLCFPRRDTSSKWLFASSTPFAVAATRVRASSACTTSPRLVRFLRTRSHVSAREERFSGTGA